MGRLPEGWFAGPPEVEVDGDEVLVVGELAEPEPVGGGGPEGPGASREARASFRWDDPLRFDEQLTEDERTARERYDLPFTVLAIWL